MQQIQTDSYATLAVPIRARYESAFDYIADPQNGPEWAVHFFKKVSKTDNGYVATVPFGEVPLAYDSDPSTGVVDIKVGDGPAIPTRLVRNGQGVVYLFHLPRDPGMPNNEWQQGVDNLSEELDILCRKIEGIANV